MARSRRRRKKQKHPNVSSMSLLRPLLDKRFNDTSLVETDTELLEAELDSFVKGLRPSEFVPVLLRACSHAPVQQHLDEIVPGWLDERDYTETKCEPTQTKP